MQIQFIGSIYVLLIAGTVLALIASLLLLRSYKAAVLRIMSSVSGTTRREQVSSLPDSGASINASGPEFTVENVGSTPQIEDYSSPEYLYALQGPKRTALVYSTGGLAFAAVMATANVLAAGDFVVMQWLVLLCVYAWPVVLAANLIMVPHLRTRLTTSGAYFLILLFIFSIAAARSPGVSTPMLFGSWALIDLPPTLLFLAFLTYKIRSIGPLVLACALISLLGAVVALSLLVAAIASPDSPASQGFFTIGAALGMSAGAIVTLFVILGIAIFGLLGWLGIRQIATRYQRKKVNDLSLTIDSLWLLFGSTQALGIAFTHPAWILAAVAGFAAYKGVTRAGLSKFGFAASTEPPVSPLLYLRVFALGNRSRKAFDAITRIWHYLGTVQVIAGPDLATTTVEPHEFTNYLSGNIARDFIGDTDALDRKLANLDTERDFDGRYRINDFFCFDDTWRAVLLRLVNESDVVFMDLRGFSSANAGATFEIHQLVNSVPLSKVTIAIDDSTDVDFVKTTITSAWNHAEADSPARMPGDNRIRLVHLGNASDEDLSKLTARLVLSAAG